MRPRYQPTREERDEMERLAKAGHRAEALAATYHEGGKNDGRCMCLVSTCGAADGCEGPGEFEAINDEVSVRLCQRCFEDHPSLALEIIEAATW